MNETVKTIARLAASGIVMILGMFNLTLDTGSLEQIITGVIMVAVLVYDCWKNSNFTPAAKLAQQVLDALKDGSITQDEVIEILESEE